MQVIYVCYIVFNMLVVQPVSFNKKAGESSTILVHSKASGPLNIMATVPVVKLEHKHFTLIKPQHERHDELESKRADAAHVE